MDAATNPPISPAPENTTPPEPSPLLDRLTNVITAPGEAFDDLKGRPVVAWNWVLPLLLSCLGGVLYCVMAFSQPGVMNSIRDVQEQALQKQVAAGKLPQDKADAAVDMMQHVTKIFAPVGAVIASCAGLFLMALAIWLAAKLADSNLGYMKVVEICGLALVIDVPQKILRTWLVTWKENMLVTFSPTLFLQHPDLQNRTHVLLALIDPLDFWWLAVLSLGVSRVGSVRYRTAALMVFGIWFVFGGLRVLMTKTS